MGLYGKIKQMADWVSQTKTRRLTALLAFILLVYLPVFIDRGSSRMVPMELHGSAKHYFSYAYNLQKHGVYTRSFSDLKPSAYREPGYPFFLSLCMRLIPDLRAATWNDLMTVDDDGHYVIHEKTIHGFMYIKYIEFFILFILSLLSCWLCWKLTGNIFLGFVVMIFSGLSHKFMWSANSMHSEIVHAFLLLVFSICMFFVVEKKKLSLFALSGCLLCCLTLTRASWFYHSVPGVLFCLYLCRVFPAERRRLLTGTAIFLICFSLTAGAWMARNYYHFNRAFITERGGVVLGYRANINMMTWKEYFAAFGIWTKEKKIRQFMLTTFFNPADYARLDRDSSNCFYENARERRRELRKIHGDNNVADKIHMKENMSKILRHPLRHVLATAPLSYRGVQFFGPFLINVMVGIGFFAALIIFAIKGRMSAVAVFVPTAVMFLFNCLVTHNIPRFNLPFFPMFVVGCVVCLKLMADQYRQQTADRKA